eukprot:2741946-Karenia_brevis.AAC.1
MMQVEADPPLPGCELRVGVLCKLRPKGELIYENGRVSEKYPDCIQARSKSVVDQKSCHTCSVQGPLRKHLLFPGGPKGGQRLRLA